MATSLAEIRAKLQAQDTRSAGGGRSPGDNAIYPHWNISEGSSTRIRFLPDGNASNDFFWAERLMIRLPFAGVKGQSDSKPVIVQVPCVEMYKEACPILAEVRGWFKDASLEDMGRKYWKKKSYLFQGFVRENALADDKAPDNPIRRFVISPQIFNLIKAALMDPELENLPTDITAGLDFTVTKTSKGGYADYSTSKWSRRESALTADEQAAIDTHGLFNLSDFLPKQPGEVELKVIKEMFEASVDGEAYDAERWGQYYRPPGMMVTNTAPATQSAESSPAVAQPTPGAEIATPAPVVEAAPASVAETVTAEAPASDSSKRAEDILAMIRNRSK